MAIYLILLDGIRWYKPILRRNHDSNGTILFKPCLLGCVPMRFPLSIDVGQPSINDEETSQRECSVSPCLLRPSCSWNSWDELAQDVRRSQISKGIPQGLKKMDFYMARPDLFPVLWMDQVSWDDSCRLHWALSTSQLIHVLFGATIQWRSGIGSPCVWNLAGSYLNRTQMIFVQQVLVVFRQKPLTISINLPILGDVLLAICLAKSWKIRTSHWQNWQMALAQTCWPLLFHSLIPKRNVATQHRYRALEILTRFLMPCECVTWQQGPDVGTRAK